MVEVSFAEKLRRRREQSRDPNVRPRGSEEALARQQLELRQQSEYAFQQMMLRQGLGVERDIPPASGRRTPRGQHVALRNERSYVSSVIASVPSVDARRLPGRRRAAAEAEAEAAAAEAEFGAGRGEEAARGVAQMRQELSELVRASRTTQLREASSLPSLGDGGGGEERRYDARGPPPAGPAGLPRLGARDDLGYARAPVAVSAETLSRAPFGAENAVENAD